MPIAPSARLAALTGEGQAPWGLIKPLSSANVASAMPSPRRFGAAIDPAEPTHYAARPMLQGLTHQARAAKPWTFAEARNILARLLRVRLDTDAERDLAASLIASDQIDEALSTFPALARPVVFQCGYGA